MFDQKAYNKRRNDELKASGVCSRCKKAPAVDGKTKCESCAKWQVNYLKKWKKAKIASGICVNCGGKNDRKGLHHCATCENIKTFRNVDARYRRQIVGW